VFKKAAVMLVEEVEKRRERALAGFEREAKFEGRSRKPSLLLRLLNEKDSPGRGGFYNSGE